MNFIDDRLRDEKNLYDVCRRLSYLMYKDNDTDFPTDVYGNILLRNHRISVCKPSYILSFNETTQTLYVGVRGTKDVNDCLTDAMGLPVDFYGTKAHLGFVQSANYLFKKMKDALSGLNRDIVITGHSLGGAAASAFAIKLKTECPNLKSVKCITFGCPGVISIKSVDMCYSYITAFVNIGDIVPFACMKNILPMSVGGAKSVMNFTNAMKNVKEEPTPLPLSMATEATHSKVKSTWPLLVPPGRIIALGLISKDNPDDIGYVEIKNLREYFERIPEGLKIMNHGIAFYGEMLEKALAKMM
ncbi:hypothetical protein TRFO_23360 [Tritrichomonas foetus]|uniref:Fungal lipase-type domain-containing protein n=1 Tax=Tritrichomonas foetus TaxID=1144522 RepID=A0A1J4KF37_9EUKA|nr:hypothetical protein TRFO_23360 [Tritrichomonas foetus]|eukprot:OHT08206.1 hypothetical protein TRFO_23360 [Tritrichomonas foetus]